MSPCIKMEVSNSFGHVLHYTALFSLKKKKKKSTKLKWQPALIALKFIPPFQPFRISLLVIKSWNADIFSRLVIITGGWKWTGWEYPVDNDNLIHLLLIKLLFGQFACGQILFSLSELLIYESWWNEFRRWLFYKLYS